MGANFHWMAIPPGRDRREVKTLFQQARDWDRFENGRFYSGGFGMASGLTFTGDIFKNETEAYDWLSDNAQKWEDALAVQFFDENYNLKWMIGALCAS